MKRILFTCCLTSFVPCFAHEALGHGTPINAYVKAATRQLAVFDGFEPGELESFGGSDIFTDTPGIGISSLVNGIAPSEAIFLNVVEGLLFWDGSALSGSDETLVIDWPDSGGISPIESYQITSQTGYQSGMLWGNYQPAGGTGGWDAHGDYALESSNPPAGIYGVVLQIDSPSYIASEPFLVPLVYDPASMLSASDVTDGIAELQQAVAPLPSADFDRNSTVDAVDLSIWQAGLDIPGPAFQVQGDADLDGHIAGSDFLTWQTQFSAGTFPNVSESTSQIPEASTVMLTAWLSVIWSAHSRARRSLRSSHCH